MLSKGIIGIIPPADLALMTGLQWLCVESATLALPLARIRGVFCLKLLLTSLLSALSPAAA